MFLCCTSSRERRKPCKRTLMHLEKAGLTTWLAQVAFLCPREKPQVSEGVFRLTNHSPWNPRAFWAESGAGGCFPHPSSVTSSQHAGLRVPHHMYSPDTHRTSLCVLSGVDSYGSVPSLLSQIPCGGCGHSTEGHVAGWQVGLPLE